MNNFGGFAGGPLSVPGLYRGKDKTFFFASFEALRLPRETPLVMSVPSLAMRSGDLSYYLLAPTNNGGPIAPAPVYNYDGTAFANSQVPVSPTATSILNTLFPLPNTGDPNSFQNNYAVNLPCSQ